MHRKQFIILILLLVIGFASVTTTLVLNGTIGVGVELDDFDVIFVEALLDGKEDTKAIISSDKKTITFSTDKFINKGESARLDYKVKNTSTQYDADVTINCTNDASDYVTIESSFDGNTIPLISSINMKAQEVKNGYINVELTKAYPGDDTSIEIKCSINFTATSREEYAYSLSFNSNGGSKIDDKSIVLNDNYGELSIPEREGYNFLGWYDEEDNKVDSSTVFDTKGNRNLYAKWEEKVYSVKIITNANGTSEASTIDVSYSKTNDIKITPSNNYYISKVECSDGYTTENYNSKVPKYGEQTITIKNNKAPNSGSCTFTFAKGVYDFSYTGSEQEFNPPLSGNYKIELWGAQGGSYRKDGGAGAYTSGILHLNNVDNIYTYVGSRGENGGNAYNFNPKASFNGGGAGANTLTALPYPSSPYVSSSGGGATDIRLKNGEWDNFESIKSRIMVAGAGGGDAYYPSYAGEGGTLTGNSSTSSDGSYGGVLGSTGGTQTSGGQSAPGTTTGSTEFKYGNNGFFFIGGNAVVYDHPGGGGGGGYYGGAAGGSGGSSVGGSSGGGGSSFISGHNGCDAISKDSTSSNIIHTGQPNHYSGYVFTNTKMIAGNALMPTHDGTSTMTGNSGNGYAKITLISID